MIHCHTDEKDHRCDRCDRRIPAGHKFWTDNIRGWVEHTNCLDYEKEDLLPHTFGRHGEETR